MLNELAPAAGRIYVMRSSPTLPFDGPAWVVPRSWLYTALKGETLCSAPAHTLHGDNVFTWLRATAGGFHNFRLIDMTNAICPHDICRAEQDGRDRVSGRPAHDRQFCDFIGPTLVCVMNLPLATTQGGAAVYQQTP